MGRAFAAGVVATDVDREVIGVLVEVAEEFQVVGRAFSTGVAVFLPMLQPTITPSWRFAQMADSRFEAAVGESDAVDDGAVLGEPEECGTRVAGLRLRGDGSDLHESEAHRRKAPRKASPLRSNPAASPTGLAKRMPKTSRSRRGAHGVAFVQQPAPSGNPSDEAQEQEHDAVCPLDREREEQGLYDLTVHNCGQR